MEACYCATTAEAIERVMGMMPSGSSISWGGSMTIRDMGLTAALHDAGCYDLIDRDLAKDRDEAQEMYRKAFFADFYLSSANAISEDGVIVNIDGNGNRVAAMCFGPKSVVIVAGMNKVVKDMDEAVSQVRNYTAPAVLQRFPNFKTPCNANGLCADCKTPDSCCCYMVETRICRPAGKIKVVLVGEDLGL